MTWVETIFGNGGDLAAHHMAARAAVLFFTTLVLVRMAGMRAFGHGSPFDTIVVIVLGSVLSRAITGASPFWPTVAAAGTLAVIHRVLAMLGVRFPRAARVLNGKPRVLYRAGHFEASTMLRHGISDRDLEQAVREHGLGRVDDADEIRIETTGALSVIAKRDGERRD